MQIIIKSTELELTDALRIYVTEKFSSIEKIIKSFETNGELILKVEIARTTHHHNKGMVFYVECSLPIGDNILRIEQTDQDMHAAIDLAQGRLKEEVEQFKKRKIEKNRKEIDKIKNK
jgi:ribosomal subunit interface protein